MAYSRKTKEQSKGKYTDLKQRLVFLALALVVYRIGAHIPVPGIDPDMLQQLFNQQQGGILGLFNMFSGGALSRFSLFALGIMPYISAAIILQMLSYVMPSLEALRKEGESGRRKITQYTRYTTLFLGLFQAFGISAALQTQPGLVINPGFVFQFTCVVSLVTGTMFLMWLGEQITERGLGNGISIILFAGILSRIPNMVSGMVDGVQKWSAIKAGTMTLESLTSAGYTEAQAQAYLNGALAPWAIVLLVVGMLALIAFIVFINDAERRIPVQYAKRQVGRKMYGGQSSTLPMKVNMSGVLPIIFAQSIASLPITVWTFIGMPKEGTISYSIYNAIDTKSVIYMVVYFIMIIGFSYFYSSIQFNPVEIANNLKKNGGFIPGFRPGNPTAAFIQKVLNKVTLFGAVYLGIVAILPLIIGKIVNVAALSIGGTSVIIVVGVALETVQALESQMLMRQYKGFLE